MITIGMGPGNSGKYNINHTREITREIIEDLGGNPENIEILVNGSPYTGPLAQGTEVQLRQKTNGKGAH